MNDVMVDIESLGVRAGCAILSIGAVAFDNDGLGKEFYRVISIRSCLDAGLRINEDTLAWWKKQEHNEILELVKNKEVAIPLKQALEEFADFLRSFGDDVKFWGNGAIMDNAVILYAAEACGVDIPVKYWNHLCYRTISQMYPEIKRKRVGTYHNALDDAKTQALHFIEIMKG
jgi:hypothetical protein